MLLDDRRVAFSWRILNRGQLSPSSCNLYNGNHSQFRVFSVMRAQCSIERDTYTSLRLYTLGQRYFGSVHISIYFLLNEVIPGRANQKKIWTALY